MKIRRYMGNNTQEAILKVKMDLGNNAIILNTRKVRQKGIFKLFSKPMVEVLAAVDDNNAGKVNPPNNERVVARQEERMQPIVKQNQVSSRVDEKEEKFTQLENKVNNMEVLLQKVYEQVVSTNVKKNEDITPENQESISKVLELFYNNLVKNEVDIEIAKRIIETVKEKVGDNANFNNAATVLYNVISGILGTPETMRLREDGKPTIAIFLGPTGVGKTTTLAKIAANYALNYKKNIALITADTYRIAAVDQLKTYAEILGMPISVIYSINEINDAIKQHSDKDIILIDTAGRSHRNKSQFEELKTLVQACEAEEIYLVLSTTTSMRNCKEILNNYSFLKDYKLIFTKLDETALGGIILNTRYLTNKALSYMTTGQSVPDDIEVANIDRITKNLLGSIT